MKFYIIFIFILLFMFSCNYSSKKDKQKDSFYTQSSGFDYRRLPLIRPYEAKSIDKKKWDIVFHTKSIQYYRNAYEVRKVSIKEGVIMIYSSNTHQVTDIAKIYQWFVVMPEKQIEKGFETEQEFLDYLKEIGIEKPEMKDIDTLHDQFEKTKCLDWIPDCK